MDYIGIHYRIFWYFWVFDLGKREKIAIIKRKLHRLIMKGEYYVSII